MVHGIDFLGRRQIVVPQSTNININYGNGYGNLGPNGAIFAGRVPYGTQYQFMNNPYGYPPERSGGGFLGKLLLGLGLGFLASKIFGGKSAEGDGKSGNANESGGFFKKIGNLLKSSDSEKSENAEEPTDSKGNAKLTTAHKGLEAANKGLTLVGIVSNNTNANTKTSIDNMKKAETSEALLRAINDASKQFDDINADFVQKIDNFNKKYSASLDGDNIKEEIKTQEKTVKEADKEFDAKAKAYNAAEATIKKTESDYKQALDNYNSIQNNIADYRSKANAAGIKDDVKQTYLDNITKLESDLSTAKKKLDDAEKAKQDAIAARDKAKTELSESEKKLKNEQTKLNELKNLQNAQEERIDFDKAISKQIKRLEKLSKKENKKMERYERKADKWEDKSAKRAENGRTEGSQRAEDKQTKWQNKLNSTREHHVDFNSGETTILQNNNTSSSKSNSNSNSIYQTSEFDITESYLHEKLQLGLDRDRTTFTLPQKNISFDSGLDFTTQSMMGIKTNTSIGAQDQEPNDAQLKEYLATDKTYLEYFQQLKEMSDDMEAIERKCGNAIPNLENSDQATIDRYNGLELLFKNRRNNLQKYQIEMKNWKDGPLPANNNSCTVDGKTYTNLERITLKNGQKAWKSDQGVFYPLPDGYIGGLEVPRELYEE